MAQFDDRAIGIANVERGAQPTCAVSHGGSFDDVEAPRRCQCGEVDLIDDEAEVIEASVGVLAADQVDDGVAADANRRKRGVAAPPLVHAHG